MNDFILKQMLGRLASKMQNEQIKAILVTPTDNGGIEIDYLRPENEAEPLALGEIILMKKEHYDALKSEINKFKLAL